MATLSMTSDDTYHSAVGHFLRGHDSASPQKVDRGWVMETSSVVPKRGSVHDVGGYHAADHGQLIKRSKQVQKYAQIGLGTDVAHTQL